MKGVAKMKDKSIQVLKLMAEGHTLDEALVSGERVVIDDFSQQKAVWVDWETFKELLGGEYLQYKKTVRQGHPILHGKVVEYSITDKGKEIIIMPVKGQGNEEHGSSEIEQGTNQEGETPDKESTSGGAPTTAAR